MNNIKYILNGLNDKNYLLNKNKVNYDSKVDDNRIKELAVDIKSHNVRLYLKTILKYKFKKFAYITFPSIVIGLSVFGIVKSVNTKTKIKNLEIYNKCITILDENNNFTTVENNNYLSSREYKVVNDETYKNFTGDNNKTYVELYVDAKDQDENYYCKYEITDVNNLISFKYTNRGIYIFPQIEEFTENNEYYQNLYDQLIKKFKKDYSYVSLDGAKIVLKCTKYDYVEDRELVVKHDPFGEICSYIVIIVSQCGFMIIVLLYNWKIEIVDVKDGKFIYRTKVFSDTKFETREIKLNTLFEIKSAYRIAEEERINILNGLLEDYASDNTKNLLLSNFEKKLVKGNNILRLESK